MSSVKKVLIIGGGIGGLSLGIALRRANIEAEIVEINKEYNVYGVGIIQQANALRALGAIGVAEETMRRGLPYNKVSLFTGNGHPIGQIGMPPLDGYPPCNGVSRRILHDVLYEAAVANGVVFRMGLTVSAIENEGTRVGVQFTDGTEGQYQLVVGADGINSKVRGLIFGDYTPRYIGSSVWRYPFPRHADLEDGFMFFGQKCKIGFIPMSPDTMYMFVNNIEGDEKQIIPESELVPRMKSLLEEFTVRIAQDAIAQINDPKKVIYRPLETLFVEGDWYKNRVVMMGDAVHGTIPQLGSGAALAIEDAVVLAEELAKDQSVEDVLAHYQSRRYERCKTVVDVSNTIAEWEQLQWQGKPLPEGANMQMLMGKTLMGLAAPI